MANCTTIECLHCEERIGLAKGIGRFAYPAGSKRPMVMERSSQVDRDAIEAIEQAHTIDWHQVGITIGIQECPKCHSIGSYFMTEINYGTGQTFHSSCPCPECATPTVEWETPYEELRCHHCGKNGFKPVGFKWMD